jgi:putative endonuclease
MKTEKRKTGDFGENMAVRYLRRKHYKILGRNCVFGKLELDIVAKTRTDIVFVEVKTRSFENIDGSLPYGRPSDAVDLQKRRNTVNAAYAYLKEHPSDLNMRIDVIEVYLDKSAEKPKVIKIEHIENAVTGKNI